VVLRGGWVVESDMVTSTILEEESCWSLAIWGGESRGVRLAVGIFQGGFAGRVWRSLEISMADPDPFF
jgi:hypothetical protein